MKHKTKGNPEVTKETNQSPKFAWSAGLLDNIYLTMKHHEVTKETNHN
jgi:hypothetical protein